MSADPDVFALRAWLDAQGVEGGALTDVRTLRGGTQNQIGAFVRGGRALVVRRQPVREGSAGVDSARREARVLRALAGTDVPHPRLVGVCLTADVLGTPFQVSELVEGTSLWEAADPSDRETRALRAEPSRMHEIGAQIATGFGVLARQDPRALGLDDLGRGAGWVARQPERWGRVLRTQRAQVGLAARLEGADEIHDWLVDHVPADDQPGVVHGDAHLGNVLVHRDGSGVSIIDWELATVGDPLLDLAELLVTWPTPGSPYAWRVRDHGLPDEAVVIDQWRAASGRSVDRLPWFRVLAGYRLAVLLEGTHVRALQGKAPQEIGADLHRRAQELMRNALYTSALINISNESAADTPRTTHVEL
ncbi:phosphotransferase family protein [Janibacter limosus]|uniref:Phosphotransferase family protein n=1 Tax=Janibacter limosus TaxID=53458 RepID=A0A4P6MYP1_9MICO|nr:phosphotransferase family protein [Janibacter limosus]QBF47105.1 phosphotransferase family protein [Janibacter limosus]